MLESKTLARAFSILDCFSVDQPRLGVRELARQVRMSRSTVGRLLATMCSAGVLNWRNGWSVVPPTREMSCVTVEEFAPPHSGPRRYGGTFRFLRC